MALIRCLIAQAKASGSDRVVSHENKLEPTAEVPKVPNVANHFGVRCMKFP